MLNDMWIMPPIRLLGMPFLHLIVLSDWSLLFFLWLMCVILIINKFHLSFKKKKKRGYVHWILRLHTNIVPSWFLSSSYAYDTYMYAWYWIAGFKIKSASEWVPLKSQPCGPWWSWNQRASTLCFIRIYKNPLQQNVGWRAFNNTPFTTRQQNLGFFF